MASTLGDDATVNPPQCTTTDTAAREVTMPAQKQPDFEALYKAENRKRIEAQTRLRGAESELQVRTDDLQAREKELEQCRHDLEHERQARAAAEYQRDQAKANMKQVAGKLTRIMTQDQYKVTDDYLETSFMALRHSIRDWAQEHFSGPVPTVEESRWSAEEDVYRDFCLTPLAEDAVRFLLSEDDLDCSNMVQAFVWEMLRTELFNSVLWAEGVRDELVGLNKKLRELGQRRDVHRNGDEARISGSSDTTTEKKYQNWSALTTRLLLEFSAEEDERDPKLTQRAQDLVEDVHGVLDPWQRKETEWYFSGLFNITKAALTLDKEICKQLAKVRIVAEYESRKYRFGYDGEIMEFDERDGLTEEEEAVVRLVISPALVKWGNSSGEHYDQRKVLVPMKVTARHPVRLADPKNRK